MTGSLIGGRTSRPPPTMNSSAAPMMPTPAMPHMVEVPTVTRNWVDAVLAARRGAQRRHVVAGQRLVGRRDPRLHLGILAGIDLVDGLGFELDLPAGRRRAGQLDRIGRRAAGIGDDDRDRGSAYRLRRGR